VEELILFSPSVQIEAEDLESATHRQRKPLSHRQQIVGFRNGAGPTKIAQEIGIHSERIQPLLASFRHGYVRLREKAKEMHQYFGRTLMRGWRFHSIPINKPSQLRSGIHE
jgi:hypothetical protein